MVYSRQYNTRNSGAGSRFNTSGQFVAAGSQQPQQQQQQQQFTAPPPPPPPQPQYPPRNVQSANMKSANSQPQQQFPNSQDLDVVMKEEPTESKEATGEDTAARPHWMKSKLPGVKKISKKEKRRRQNEHLRRLITPKNALMVLNEMVLTDQLTNQFKVEPAEVPNQYYKTQKTSFCADLTLDGVSYKGYGENKLVARNAAAEQAIRDLIIKRMQKAVAQDLTSDDHMTSGESASGAEEEDPLPMIQLASFALHKLFSEWEYEGHKVPQLRPPTASTSEAEAESTAGSVAAGGKPRAPKKPKEPKQLPAAAAAMHPCMLLMHMRPQLEYRELAVSGDRPQDMTFTIGVDVDGATYIGKASNKKEARKAAARAACSALFGVQFAAPQPAA